MSDPVSASMLALASFGGAAMQAAGSPGGGAQIDPQVAAALEQQGVDIRQFEAQQQAQQGIFSQLMAQYGINTARAKQFALNDVLGGVGGPQDQMKNFIQSAFSGAPTDANKNELAQFGISSGREMKTARSNVEDMLANSGLDPRSPAYAKVKADLEAQLQSGFNANETNLRSKQAYQNLATAMPMYSALQNGPLAGTMLPNTPNVAGQEGPANNPKPYDYNKNTRVKHPTAFNVPAYYDDRGNNVGTGGGGYSGVPFSTNRNGIDPAGFNENQRRLGMGPYAYRSSPTNTSSGYVPPGKYPEDVPGRKSALRT